MLHFPVPPHLSEVFSKLLFLFRESGILLDRILLKQDQAVSKRLLAMVVNSSSIHFIKKEIIQVKHKSNMHDISACFTLNLPIFELYKQAIKWYKSFC